MGGRCVRYGQKDGYKGEGKGRVRVQLSYEVKKKRQNLLRNLHRRKKNLFFIYDVIVKQFFYKSSTNHYSCVCLGMCVCLSVCVHLCVLGCVYLCVSVCVCMCACVGVCGCVGVCVCVCG